MGLEIRAYAEGDHAVVSALWRLDTNEGVLLFESEQSAVAFQSARGPFAGHGDPDT